MRLETGKCIHSYGRQPLALWEQEKGQSVSKPKIGESQPVGVEGDSMLGVCSEISKLQQEKGQHSNTSHPESQDQPHVTDIQSWGKV